MTAVIDALGQFPRFEPKVNSGFMSAARRLMSMKMMLLAMRLFVGTLADVLEDLRATQDEIAILRAMVKQQFALARNLVTNSPMERPVWPTAAGIKS